MKKNFNLMALSFCCLGAMLITACSNDDNEGPADPVAIAHPIESVTAADGSTTATAVISDADKTIKFGTFQELTDLSAVTVTFKTAKGATLKTPAKTTASLDLSSPYKVTVNNGVSDVIYTMTATAKEVIPTLITAAKVGSENATIDDKTITIAYKDGMDINAMVFDFTLASGVTVKSPADKTFDLETGDKELVVTYKEIDYTYTVKMTGYTDPMVAKGWAKVSENKFGALPNHIKVYVTDKLNGVNKDSAYVAIVDPKAATISAIDGNNPATLTLDAATTANPNWNLYFIGINNTATQLTTIDGNFTRGGTNSYATLGIDASGNASIKYAGLFEGQLYSYSSYAAITGAGTAWNVKFAFSGIVSVLTNNTVKETDEVGTSWFDGNARSGRACIGVTADNKILFFVCQTALYGATGVSMIDLGKVMKDLGATDAVSFEGSGTADMRVNAKYTVHSKYIFNSTTGDKLADQSGAKKYQSVLVVK